MANLFHLISPYFKHQTALSLFTTYFLFPLMITMGVLGSELVMPNGLGATLVLFLAVSICCLLLAVGLSFLKQLLTYKIRTALYILSGAIAPFAIWYGFTLTI
ncbi:MAG: hypothetical protein ACK5PU_00305 [bacterium]